ncbi:MAG TPA: hypothetical protein VD769_00580 [Gaiellaceae bacterium]|nr:hypothetical protein [Gaiellaceae bacterium]
MPAAPAAERDGDADGSAEACPENRLWADCPEAAWASRVAERAGFAVTGDTQSALIVEGRGASFYLWATPLTKPVAEIAVEEGWRRLGRSGGAAVYGDGRLWQWWVAQQRVVWLKAGPTPSARLPTLTELAALVRAGRELAVTAK